MIAYLLNSFPVVGSCLCDFGGVDDCSFSLLGGVVREY